MMPRDVYAHTSNIGLRVHNIRDHLQASNHLEASSRKPQINTKDTYTCNDIYPHMPACLHVCTATSTPRVLRHLTTSVHVRSQADLPQFTHSHDTCV